MGWGGWGRSPMGLRGPTGEVFLRVECGHTARWRSTQHTHSTHTYGTVCVRARARVTGKMNKNPKPTERVLRRQNQGLFLALETEHTHTAGAMRCHGCHRVCTRLRWGAPRAWCGPCSGLMPSNQRGRVLCSQHTQAHNTRHACVCVCANTHTLRRAGEVGGPPQGPRHATRHLFQKNTHTTQEHTGTPSTPTHETLTVGFTCRKREFHRMYSFLLFVPPPLFRGGGLRWLAGWVHGPAAQHHNANAPPG